MNSPILPWKSLSETLSVGSLVDGWNLAEVPEDHSDSPRSFSVPVTFTVPFVGVPVVQVGLAGFDIDQRDSARLNVQATNITSTGFTAVFTTWRETRIYSASISWLAVGH